MNGPRRLVNHGPGGGASVRGEPTMAVGRAGHQGSGDGRSAPPVASVGAGSGPAGDGGDAGLGAAARPSGWGLRQGIGVSSLAPERRTHPAPQLGAGPRAPVSAAIAWGGDAGAAPRVRSPGRTPRR